jgi:hypothetical protein
MTKPEVITEFCKIASSVGSALSHEKGDGEEEI